MRLAILTGGSRGLGFALCRMLVERGYHVLELSRGAPHAGSLRVDLASPAASREVLAAALASLDDESLEELVVISNAGTLDPIGPASRKAPAAVLANLNTNFTSAILVLTEVVAKYQATPCRKVLVNISSGAVHKAHAGWSLYSAAKAGMEHFVRALALEQEVEPHPFVPINVDPGVIDTEMQALIRRSTPLDFPEVERFIERKEQGGLAAPKRVAAAVFQILESPSLTSGARYAVGDY